MAEGPKTRPDSSSGVVLVDQPAQDPLPADARDSHRRRRHLTWRRDRRMHRKAPVRPMLVVV